MSSILTNTSAMVALQTMKSINSNMNKVQSEISTGKTVSTARDNAAVWAISKVMESDVKGFKGISDSLALGSSTLTVAREASEKIQTLLSDMKAKIVAAQGENVPREKLQTDVDALRGQIAGIVGAAQFSGLNLISGVKDVNFLASLDRSSTGVATSDITVARQDLGTGTGTVGTTDATVAANIIAPTAAIEKTANSADFVASALLTGNSAEITVAGKVLRVTAAADMTADEVATALSLKINDLGLKDVSSSTSAANISLAWTGAFTTLEAKAGAGVAAPGTASAGIFDVNGSVVTLAQRAETVSFGGAKVAEGDGYSITMGGSTYSYIAAKGETVKDVANGLKIAIDSAKIADLSTQVRQDANGVWGLHIDNNSATSITAPTVDGSIGGTASGGLFGLDAIDVTTSDTARSALSNIETMINRAIDAAAQFGSAQGRIDIQRGFVTALSDAMISGIGTLVDADMEEASARLQALQVQQQLGIQALSIANQQPQNLLALFR